MRKLLLLAAFAIAFASCKKDEESPLSGSCQLSVEFSDSARTDTTFWVTYLNGKIDKIFSDAHNYSKFTYTAELLTTQRFNNDTIFRTETYHLNPQGFATMKIAGNDTTLYAYNPAGQMETVLGKSNGDTILFKKHVFEAGNIVKEINLISADTTTYEYDSNSPTLKWNPYFSNGSPGEEHLGKPLANKIPAKKNGSTTNVSCITNSAGYPIIIIKGTFQFYLKYSNCQ